MAAEQAITVEMGCDLHARPVYHQRRIHQGRLKVANGQLHVTDDKTGRPLIDMPARALTVDIAGMLNDFLTLTAQPTLMSCLCHKQCPQRFYVLRSGQ